MTTYADAEKSFAESRVRSAETISAVVGRIDRKMDEGIFLNENEKIFQKPDTFSYDRSPVDDVLFPEIYAHVAITTSYLFPLM